LRRPRGQGGKFHSRFCWYLDGVVHALCPPESTCEACAPKHHKRCRRRAERALCGLCTTYERTSQHWYDSRAEAKTALRLDGMLLRGEIAAWRRARRVVLQDAIDGQRPIFYTPDFVVTFNGGVVRVWEVKGSEFVIADDARLKIKMYRAVAVAKRWPSLDVVNPKGDLLHV
jgi:hypothetical protein